MSYFLVVTKPFGAFRRGTLIEDHARIEEILASEHKDYVVRVATSVGN